MQVMPVIKWDDTEFLQTKPDPEVGILALSLRALLEEDMDPTNNRRGGRLAADSCEEGARTSVLNGQPVRAGHNMWRCPTAC